jgi:hypothetical protein
MNHHLMHASSGENWASMTDTTSVFPGRKADPDRVIERYQELHNLEKTGREFGITRERVRQIVNRAGISTARIIKSKPERPERLCKECGEPVNSSHALYCETHRKEKHKRRYRAIKADPEKYAHWRELLKKYDRKRKDRARDRMPHGDELSA